MLRKWMERCSVLLVVIAAQVALAQGPGGPGGPGGGPPGTRFPGGFDNSLMLLRDESVLKELEIVDSQQEKLRAIGEKMREEMGSLFQGMRDLSEEDRRAKFAEIQEKLKARQEEVKKQLDEVLLPQQRDRLKQLAVQARMRFQSAGDVISSGEVAETLQLTDAQKTELAEKQKSLEEEYRKENEALRNKYRDRLLEVLTPEQKAKWEQLVGKSFEFQPAQFGRFRGPGGGAGGPPARPEN